MIDNFEEYIIVKPSTIHGLGIFTTVSIPKGSEILLISGEVISEEECIKREELGNVYIFWNENNYIDTSQSKKIKYINHNCEFNCDVIDGNENTLRLIAYKNIPADEELTIDYGYEEIYEHCKCSHCL